MFYTSKLNPGYNLNVRYLENEREYRACRLQNLQEGYKRWGEAKQESIKVLKSYCRKYDLGVSPSNIFF